MEDKKLKNIEKAFVLSLEDMENIIRDFHSDMAAGLSGSKSSLKMIRTYVGKPSGDERGSFIALDLGGTNFRILGLELQGGGKTGRPVSESFVIDKKYLTGSGKDLFDFIASCVKSFLKNEKLGGAGLLNLGFTFSFPVEQTSVASGRLIHWTKGFQTKGVIGEDVVKLLNDSMSGLGIANVKVSALANDTVGTLVAKAYEDKTCDVGVILGTGTNACYFEQALEKPMIINIEWGNFDKLKSNVYDKKLDAESVNKGAQVLEKMVSGMYLGELFRLVMNDIAGKDIIGAGRMSFKTEYMSEIEADDSKDLSKAIGVLKSSGMASPSIEDGLICKKVCSMIAKRAARISAAALASVVTKMDRDLSCDHTAAIDGSVFEKYPRFAYHMEEALKEIFREKASRIKMKLAKDGSGKGAAIIAAVASSM